MDLCHYHWRWFQPKNWVMIWFCFANHLIWGSRWHFSWTRRKSIHQVEIFRLIELDTSIQLSLSNPCFPPARFMIRNTFFSCEFGPKYHTLIKIFVHPVGRPTIFFDAAGGSSPLLMVWSVSVHHEMFFFPRECSVHHEMCIVQYAEALFSSHPINPVNTKKTVTSNVSTHVWSTKWSLFTIFFA